jgi:RNA polymerase sigma factor (sigma-70 family)
MYMQDALINEFYLTHKTWLYHWLCKKVSCSSDAADLAQDTFTRLLTKQEAEPIREPRAYLTTIAHGLLVNLLRRRDLEQAYIAAMTALHGSAGETGTPSPEQYMLALERIIALDHMLKGLPTKARIAFLLHRIDGLRYAEIAEELGVTVSSVKKYIAKAMLHCALAAE